MRTHFITFGLLFALGCMSSVCAQNANKSTKSQQDSVLLSQSREGDYIVSKYLVKHNAQNNSDFAVRYRINLATMSPNLDDNNKELAELKAFMDSVSNNSMIHINSVEITGYASPDGVEASNQKLANARAQTLKSYLDTKYDLSNKYKVGVQGRVESWSACEKALDRSGVNGRDKALTVIRGRDTQVEKQRSLKSMPAVWNFLKADVLPKLRYADVEFGYNRDRIVEVRKRVSQPKPTEKPAVAQNKCCCCGEVINRNETVIEDMTNGIIVEMDEVDVDFY